MMDLKDVKVYAVLLPESGFTKLENVIRASDAIKLREERDRLLAKLEGLHFHHKMFEPDCCHCQATRAKIEP